MFCEYFVSIEEVAGNYLTSFIIEEVYYLAIAKPNVIDLGPLFISRINSYKHLILRI
jgi:orotidine-5'-phosphate decarboxylase